MKNYCSYLKDTEIFLKAALLVLQIDLQHNEKQNKESNSDCAARVLHNINI